jgi:CBS domain-containing protein
MLMKVGEFGRREVVVASAHELVTEVAQRMRAHHVGSVVVVEHALGARIPVGVVTDRDIVVGLVALDPARIERAVVSDLLVGKVVTAREDEDLDDAISRMRSHGVRRLPIVTESGTLVGIISVDDLVDHLAEQISRLAALLCDQRERERHARPTRGTVLRRKDPPED